MKNLKQWKFRIAFGCLALGALCILPVSAQDAPDVGPHPAQPLKPMESHIGNVIGHAKDAKMNYRRYCAGCHGDLGDGNGENAQWIDPKPRDFTIATFKCRSTPTGTLPTDRRSVSTRSDEASPTPICRFWNASRSAAHRSGRLHQDFSPRWEKEKPGEPIKIPAEPPVTMKAFSRQGFVHKAGMLEMPRASKARGDGPSAATLTDSKDQPIRPYDFSSGSDDSRFKCGVTNQDIYKIFMTGVDGTPMPSFADVIQPNDAWDLVHFLRTLQTHRHSKENDVLKAAGGKIPPYVESPRRPRPVQPSKTEPREAATRDHIGSLEPRRLQMRTKQRSLHCSWQL